MSATATDPAPVFVRPLAAGATGSDVLALKRALYDWNKHELAGMRLDSLLGPQAVLLLRHFQQVEGESVDGIMGPKTFAKLVALDLFDEYGEYLLLLEQRAAYRNPYRDVPNLSFAGFDQGCDFSGAGPVYAVGHGLVVVSTTRSGWPGGGAVSYRLTAGRASGCTIYFAENITPRVAVGELVTPDTVIADMHDEYPYTESGWAMDGTDNPMAQPVTKSPTYYGVNYGDLLISLGEHRCPRGGGGSETPLPPGWPRWLP